MEGGGPHDALARRVGGQTLEPAAAPPRPPQAPLLARIAAYVALGLTLLGLPLIDRSESECRFDPDAQNNVGTLGERGRRAPHSHSSSPLFWPVPRSSGCFDGSMARADVHAHGSRSSPPWRRSRSQV